MRISILFRTAVMAIGLTLPLTLTACSASPDMDMPDYVRNAPDRVQEAYLYAVSHPEDLASVPCYCGCGSMGHTSNLSCFVADASTDEVPVFDAHAAGCGICVDIAQDVMRLRAEGRSLPQVRDYIDATYSGFGPGTDTPLPVN